MELVEWSRPWPRNLYLFKGRAVRCTEIINFHFHLRFKLPTCAQCTSKITLIKCNKVIRCIQLWFKRFSRITKNLCSTAKFLRERYNNEESTTADLIQKVAVTQITNLCIGAGMTPKHPRWMHVVSNMNHAALILNSSLNFVVYCLVGTRQVMDCFHVAIASQTIL